MLARVYVKAKTVLCRKQRSNGGKERMGGKEERKRGRSEEAIALALGGERTYCRVSCGDRQTKG